MKKNVQIYKFTNVNYNRSKNINKEEIKIKSHMVENWEKQQNRL